MLEEKPIGNITITVQDDEFFDGYQAGYLRFRAHYQGQALSKGDMRLFLARNYFDGSNATRYNVGYITGWYAALFTNEPERAHVTTAQHPLQGGHL